MDPFRVFREQPQKQVDEIIKLPMYNKELCFTIKGLKGQNDKILNNNI